MSDLLRDLDRLLGTPTPVGISDDREISIEEDPEDDLLIELEGDIGDDGSDEGTAGGDSGNPSDSDGGGGGGGGNDDDDDGGLGAGEVRDIVNDILPSWVKSLGGASVVAGGTEIYLTEQPIAFVRAVVSSSLIEAVQMIVGTIASGFLTILGIVFGSLGDAGSSILGSFGSIGDVSLLLIDTLNNTIATLAAAAGPLSPIVVVIIYGGIVVIAAGAVRSGLVILGWAP